MPRSDETESPPARVVRLVLVTRSGELLGTLPPFRVATSWWPDADAVVRGVREHHRIDVTVLRLLKADPELRSGGDVTYVAETEDRPATEPWHGQFDEHPLRQSWARPRGPHRDLAWAHSVLADQGFATTGPAEQVRTWNLSSLWRLPVPGGDAWLKVVPPFFGHEGGVLERLAGARVPRLLGRDGPRILMAEIPGEDLYDAELPLLSTMVTLLVELQAAWNGRAAELKALALPDWRAGPLTAAIADVVDRTSAELSVDDRSSLARFVDGLPERFEALAGFGLPDTLVHGDFHPGNVRGDATSPVLLDWGDCGIGHPLLDQSAFLDRIPSSAVEPIRAAWERDWLRRLPDSRPAEAGRLIAPVAAARQAVIYRKFLDNIEPSEHPYHRRDPADWLRRTAELVRHKRA